MVMKLQSRTTGIEGFIGFLARTKHSSEFRRGEVHTRTHQERRPGSRPREKLHEYKLVRVGENFRQNSAELELNDRNPHERRRTVKLCRRSGMIPRQRTGRVKIKMIHTMRE